MSRAIQLEREAEGLTPAESIGVYFLGHEACSVQDHAENKVCGVAGMSYPAGYTIVRNYNDTYEARTLMHEIFHRYGTDDHAKGDEPGYSTTEPCIFGVTKDQANSDFALCTICTERVRERLLDYNHE